MQEVMHVVKLAVTAYQAADFIKDLLVTHAARLVHLVALPQEAGLVATALLDMPVKAVVGHVGAAPLEILYPNFAIVPVEVRLHMLLLKLQWTQQTHGEVKAA